MPSTFHFIPDNRKRREAETTMVTHSIPSTSPPRRHGTASDAGSPQLPSNCHHRDTNKRGNVKQSLYEESTPEYHQQDPHSGSQPQNKSLFIIMEQLVSLLNLTLQTSSKFLSPALANLAQKSFPTILQFMQQLTPLRIQHWIHILYISYANAIHLVLHSAQGQILTSNAVAIFENYLNLLTSVNMRQVIIDSMSFFIKCMNVLQTSEMKEVITSIPILTIRVIDTLSSGEAKLFYHSFSSLCSSIIEFVNQEDMTHLIAEITARFVHALEMEHCNFSPALKNRKKRKIFVAGGRRMMRRRKKKKNLPSYGGNDSGGEAAIQSKKRRERNQCMNRTYNKRFFLRDDDENEFDFDTDDETNDIQPTTYNQDRQVEDAILSSLSQDQTSYSDNAWLTKLGRPKDGASNYINRRTDNCGGDNKEGEISSLPSKVVLKNEDNEHENGNAQLSIGSSINLEELDIRSSNLNPSEDDDEHDDLTDIVDTTYLRSGIEKRRNKQNLKKGRNIKRKKQDLIDLSGNIVVDDGSIQDYTSNDSQQLDIEDLVLIDKDQTSTEKVKIEKTARRKKNKVPIVSSQEDYSTDSFYNILPNENDTSNKKTMNYIRGEESSIAHFNRALDDIASKIRNKTITEALNQNQSLTNAENNGELINKLSAKWYPKAAAAAGVGNECGQDTLASLSNAGMRKPIRFRANIGVSNIYHKNTQEETREEINHWKVIAKLVMERLTTRQKLIAGTILSLYMFFSIVWFSFGCYGVYQLITSSSSPSSTRPTISASSTSNEYVIRIVQDIYPKEVLMDTVTKAIEDRVLAGDSNFAESAAASLTDKEL